MTWRHSNINMTCTHFQGFYLLGKAMFQSVHRNEHLECSKLMITMFQLQQTQLKSWWTHVCTKCTHMTIIWYDVGTRSALWNTIQCANSSSIHVWFFWSLKPDGAWKLVMSPKLSEAGLISSEKRPLPNRPQRLASWKIFGCQRMSVSCQMCSTQMDMYGQLSAAA